MARAGPQTGTGPVDVLGTVRRTVLVGPQAVHQHLGLFDSSLRVRRAGRRDAAVLGETAGLCRGLRQQLRGLLEQGVRIIRPAGALEPAGDPLHLLVQIQLLGDVDARAGQVGAELADDARRPGEPARRILRACARGAGGRGAGIVIGRALRIRGALVLASSRAAVPAHAVAVVTLLARIDLAVAALALARGGAAVSAHGVAVVALLTRVDDAVAAGGELAVVVTAVAVDLVAVVALLARLHLAVAALALARGGAAVSAHGVAVVALLTRVEEAVAAAAELAVGIAAVTRDLVAVVALLAGIHLAVAALALTGGGAAVAVLVVAVVTLLAGIDVSVSAQAGHDLLDEDELVRTLRDRIRHGEVRRRHGARVEAEDHLVGARAAVDHLDLSGRHVAGMDDERVVVALARELVVARAADDGVLAAAAVDLVVTGAAVEQVVAALAEELVVALAAEQLVVEAAADDAVAAAVAADDVLAAVAGDAVTLVGAVDDVVGAGPRHRHTGRAGDLRVAPAGEAEHDKRDQCGSRDGDHRGILPYSFECSKTWRRVNRKEPHITRKSGAGPPAMRARQRPRPEGTVWLRPFAYGRPIGVEFGAMGTLRRRRSGVAAPEPLERLRGLARPLVRPPVAAPVEQHELPAYALRHALREARRDVGIVVSPEDERGARDARDVVLPLRAHVHRRAVETKNAVLHHVVDVLGDDARVLRRDAARREAFRERVRRHHRHDGLADARRLPLLGQIVPDVLAVDGAVAAGPGADELGPQRDHPLHEERSPVVTHQVDRLTDALDLRRQPVDVRLLGGSEAGWHRTPEPRELRREDVASREVGAQLVPEPVGVGDAVHEDCGHAGG